MPVSSSQALLAVFPRLLGPSHTPGRLPLVRCSVPQPRLPLFAPVESSSVVKGLCLNQSKLYFLFCFRPAPVAHGSSQARGLNLSYSCPPTLQPQQTRDPSCICDLCCSSRRCRIFNPLSEARDRTHILMDTGRVCNLLSHNGNSCKLYFKNTSEIEINFFIYKSIYTYSKNFRHFRHCKRTDTK